MMMVRMMISWSDILEIKSKYFELEIRTQEQILSLTLIIGCGGCGRIGADMYCK